MANGRNVVVNETDRKDPIQSPLEIIVMCSFVQRDILRNLENFIELNM